MQAAAASQHKLPGIMYIPDVGPSQNASWSFGTQEHLLAVARHTSGVPVHHTSLPAGPTQLPAYPVVAHGNALNPYNNQRSPPACYGRAVSVIESNCCCWGEQQVARSIQAATMASHLQPFVGVMV
jgi:hypothetical protein